MELCNNCGVPIIEHCKLCGACFYRPPNCCDGNGKCFCGITHEEKE